MRLTPPHRRMKYIGKLEGPETQMKWRIRKLYAGAFGAASFSEETDFFPELKRGFEIYGYFSPRGWEYAKYAFWDGLRDIIIAAPMRQRLHVYRPDA